MRLLMLAMLLLIAPGSARGQAEPVPLPVPGAEWEEAQDDRVGATPSTAGSAAAGETRLAPRVAGNDDSGAAVAQPTMGGFLYQVLLAAVTALVTALIWKAVF